MVAKLFVVNNRIQDLLFETGKPEPLKHDLAGFWSGRIDQEHY